MRSLRIGIPLLLALSLFSCADESPPPPPVSETPTVELQRAIFDEKQNGRPVWRLEAKSATYDEPKQQATLRDAKATIWDEKAKSWEVSAPTILYDQSKRLWELPQGAKGRSLRSPATFEAKRLSWQPDQKVMTGENAVLTWGRSRIQGDRLRLKADSKQVVIEQRVRAVIKLSQ